jgi:hypothetical protein
LHPHEKSHPLEVAAACASTPPLPFIVRSLGLSRGKIGIDIDPVSIITVPEHLGTLQYFSCVALSVQRNQQKTHFAGFTLV